MSWLPALAPFLVGLVLVFVPGLMVTVAARIKGFDAIAIAPAISVAIVALSAMVAPMAGVQWALWVPFVFACVVAVLAYLVVFSLDKVGLMDAPYRQPLSATVDRTPMQWKSAYDGWHFAAFAVAALLLLRNIMNAVGRPEWVSQTWDNTFHLNAVRYIADHANGSSLFVGSMTSGDEPAKFYPAAWHDLVSLIFMNSGTSIPVATSSMVLVVTSVVWPLSVLYMIRSIFPVGRFSALVVGIAAGSMPAFPYLLIYFGVLYPNLLGYSLVPVGIGMMAQLFRVGVVRRLATAQSVVLGIPVALGTALAHPNAVMSLLVLVVPVFVTRIILQIIAGVRGENTWMTVALQVVGLSGIIGLIYYLWGVVRPPQEAGGMWEPFTTQGEALGGLLTQRALYESTPLWVMTALFIWGVVSIVVSKNRLLWLLGSWGVLAYFYIAVGTLDWDEGRYDVVGVWYHDAFRIIALAPIVTLPIVAYGAHRLAGNFVAFVNEKKQSYDFFKSSNVVTGIAGAGAVVLAVALQTAPGLTSFINKSFWSYAPTDESALLGPDEVTIFEHIDDYVAEDEKIVVQAFNGGPLAYAYADREVSAYHAIWAASDDELYIYQNLNQANVDPKVCEILNRDNYRYYLEFGHIEVNGANHASWYPGFEELVENNVVREVYRAGGAKIYEITACDG